MTQGTIYVQFNGTREQARAFVESHGEGRINVPLSPGLSKFRTGVRLSVPFLNNEQKLSAQALLERLGYPRDVQDEVIPAHMRNEERRARGIRGPRAGVPYSSPLGKPAQNEIAAVEPANSPRNYAAIQYKMLRIAAEAFTSQVRQIMGVPLDKITVSVKDETATYVFTSAEPKLPPTNGELAA